MIEVSDLLGIRLSSRLGGGHLLGRPLYSPVGHLFLQQEAQGGDEGAFLFGVSVLVARPEGIHTFILQE